MALIVTNRVRVLVSTLGTGPVVFGLPFSTLFLSPAEAGAVDDDQPFYLFTEGLDFELGIGTVSNSAGEMSRDRVLVSKIGGVAGTDKMVLAGTAQLRFVDPAEVHSFLRQMIVTMGTVYTMMDSDEHILINKVTGTPTTVNLVSAVDRLKPIHIVDMKRDADTNPITIVPNGTETIRGLTSWVIDLPGASVSLYPYPDGTGWYTTGTDIFDPTVLKNDDIGITVQAHNAVLDATTASFTIADETKLDGIEAGATADQTAAEILAALITVDGAGSGLDADLLDGNSSAAFEPADATILKDADIGVTVNEFLTTVSQVDAEAGVATDRRAWSALRVAQAIAALGGGGGSSVTVSATPPVTPVNGDLWYDLDSGGLFIYVNDGTTSQWVEAAGGAVGEASAVVVSPTVLGTADVQSALEALAPAYLAGGTDVALADGGTGVSLADPNADRLLWWDDSAGAITLASLSALATEAAPASGDFLLMVDAAGVASKVDWASLPSGGGSNDRTGELVFFTGDSPPAWGLEADASAVSRTTYANLWAWVQTSGNLAASQGAKTAGEYGPGDGSTTFTLPDLITGGRFIRSRTTVGGLEADGAPDIVGSLAFGAARGISASSGAFTSSNLEFLLPAGTSGSSPRTHNFAASSSNAKYGAATEVRPINVGYLPIIIF